MAEGVVLIPLVASFRNKNKQRNDTAAASGGFLDEVYRGMCESNELCFDELASSGPFVNLDGKLAVGLRKICKGKLQRKITLLSERLAKQKQCRRGRHIAKCSEPKPATVGADATRNLQALRPRDCTHFEEYLRRLDAIVGTCLGDLPEALLEANLVARMEK